MQEVKGNQKEVGGRSGNRFKAEGMHFWGEMPIDYEIAGEEILAPEDESASICEIAGDIELEPGYDECGPVYETEE